MSHWIVEIPKTNEKGNWLLVVAENWIENDILYLPDDTYSVAYKANLLKCGMPPDVEKWDSNPCFKIVEKFGSYEEARSNLPRVEAGLPILNSHNTGRGQREKRRKRLNMPGETTEIDSEEEVSTQQSRKTAVKAKPSKKCSPKSMLSKSNAGSVPLPKPPVGLRLTKKTNYSQKKIQHLQPVRGNQTAPFTSRVGSPCNNDLPTHSTLQPVPHNKTATATCSEGSPLTNEYLPSHSSLQPVPHNKTATTTCREGSPLNNEYLPSHSSLQPVPHNKTATTTCREGSPLNNEYLPSHSTLQPVPCNKTATSTYREGFSFNNMCLPPHSALQPVAVPDNNNNAPFTSKEGSYSVDFLSQSAFQPVNAICRITAPKEDDWPGNKELEAVEPFPNDNGGYYNGGMQSYWKDNPQHFDSRHQMNPSSPSPASREFGSQHFGKVAPRKEQFTAALAKINEKLSIIEKSIKPISDEDCSEMQDDFHSLPLKNLQQLDAFESILKKDPNLLKKLVTRIRLLGKRNSKNSAADYVRRGWSTVFADSLSKEVNWLGRRDKRVNNGLGKRGISSYIITKAVLDGIRSNNAFHEMEYEFFVQETKLHLRNAKARFLSEQLKAQIEDESDSN